MLASEVAKACRIFGRKPIKVEEADEITDGIVQFDGWHLSVGANYVMPVIEHSDGTFTFFPQLKHGIVTGEDLDRIEKEKS